VAVKLDLPLAAIEPEVHEESVKVVFDHRAMKKPAGTRDHSPDRLDAPL
jgi:hypothetical protein